MDRLLPSDNGIHLFGISPSYPCDSLACGRRPDFEGHNDRGRPEGAWIRQYCYSFDESIYRDGNSAPNSVFERYQSETIS